MQRERNWLGDPKRINSQQNETVLRTNTKAVYAHSNLSYDSNPLKAKASWF
jgi:hypothetical protein